VCAYRIAQSHRGQPMRPASASSPAGLLNPPPAITEVTQGGADAKQDVFQSAPDICTHHSTAQHSTAQQVSCCNGVPLSVAHYWSHLCMHACPVCSRHLRAAQHSTAQHSTAGLVLQCSKMFCVAISFLWFSVLHALLPVGTIHWCTAQYNRSQHDKAQQVPPSRHPYRV
jgi:hypothetical protein